MPRAMDEASTLRRSLLLSAGLGLFGAGLLALSAGAIFDFAHAVMRRVPIIAWDQRGWSLLPAALALFAVALAIYIGRHAGQRVAGRRREAIRRLLILAVCMLPMATALPLSAQWLAGRYLEARGYNECVDGVWIAVGRVPEVAKTPASCRGLSDRPARTDASRG